MPQFRPEPEESGVAGSLLAGLGVAWIVLVLVLWVLQPATPEGFGGAITLFYLLALILPPAVLVVCHLIMDAQRETKRRINRLDDALAALRVTPQSSAMSPKTVEARLEEIAQTARKTEATVATFTSSRDMARSKLAITSIKTVPDDQPTLALGTSAEDMAVPLETAELIRALNFPEDERDTAGFGALRRALKDRSAGKLIKASQDVLTLLSQDGIYMDDLKPDRAKPDLWRRFAQGERGRAVAALGGIRDRSSLALTAGRMREDVIFRDAAHHFLRLFDRMLAQVEPDASDAEMIALADTRSARAFMIVARVSGVFD
ncbi:hypothetical protein SAMN05428995_10739 [Loktanella sp. DSM 29012]|uniref:hypothetical protein n=1 Tax=Loktanella sp. DSM 29012 TaxID=1881056 RepID=UPI0008B4C36C|nr:hypothetical protein [Loktanella sp. DSM 29012]SEQ73340.1 hypothetical protein SAMN05428995_10739 [Loktanella sp. DSM 29012]